MGKEVHDAALASKEKVLYMHEAPLAAKSAIGKMWHREVESSMATAAR